MRMGWVGVVAWYGDRKLLLKGQGTDGIVWGDISIFDVENEGVRPFPESNGEGKVACSLKTLYPT